MKTRLNERRTWYHQKHGASGKRDDAQRCDAFRPAAAGLAAEGHKGEPFPSDAERYPDPLTELDVYRLTKPDYSTTMTAYYNRGIAHTVVGWCAAATARALGRRFRLDLKTGDMKQMTEAEGLDGTSLTLLPDNRPFCYLSGRRIGT